MRCSRCGNENPDTHRFCGMCGGSLLQAPAATTSAPSHELPRTPAVPVSPRPSPPPAATRTPGAASTEKPVISGPSFLGLNQPPATPRKRGSLSIDPHSAGPGDLDYLLEDDQPEKSGGAWKAVLILIALGLVVGLGYLRWRNQGLSWLKQELSKPAAQSSPNPAPDSPAGDTNAPGSTPPANPTSANPAPTTPLSAGSQTPPASDPASAPPNGSSSAGVPSSSPAAAAPAALTPAVSPVPSASPAEQPPASPTTHHDPKPGTRNAAAPADDGDDDHKNATAPDAEEATPPAPGKANHAPSPKPTAGVKSLPAADPVAEAQKYIYGKGGAAQDCERGLRILKPAAAQSNPRAMVELGALYSAGLCAPRDLPTAYRWFALALRKDPENSAIQSDLEKLWGEMTQPERQLAIRLSQ